MHNKFDISELADNSKKREAQWLKYFAKNKKKVESLDLKIHDLHHEISEKIDCLSCANCCRYLGPRLTDKDIERMAKALRIKETKVIENYLRIDEDKDYVFKSMPCPFLGADNYCSIYENRPKACREYPHTDRRKFYQIYKLSVKNASTCPIVYEVMEEIQKL